MSAVGSWPRPGRAAPRPGWWPAAALTGRWRIVGVTVSRPAERMPRAGAGLAAGAAAARRHRRPAPGRVEVRGGWIGPGYGAASAEGGRAARLVAAAEGIFLDPVFGAKAMAALIANAGPACPGPGVPGQRGRRRCSRGPGADDRTGTRARAACEPPPEDLGAAARITTGPAAETGRGRVRAGDRRRAAAAPRADPRRPGAPRRAGRVRRAAPRPGGSRCCARAARSLLDCPRPSSPTTRCTATPYNSRERNCAGRSAGDAGWLHPAGPGARPAGSRSGSRCGTGSSACTPTWRGFAGAVGAPWPTRTRRR